MPHLVFGKVPEKLGTLLLKIALRFAIPIKPILTLRSFCQVARQQFKLPSPIGNWLKVLSMGIFPLVLWVSSERDALKYLIVWLPSGDAADRGPGRKRPLIVAA